MFFQQRCLKKLLLTEYNPTEKKIRPADNATGLRWVEASPPKL